MVIDENPDSEVEVSFVALVEKPAIEKNFMAFKSMQLNFAADVEKQIISGPAMVADTLIYRRDDNGEYNVFFSKETIQEIAIKFFKKDYQKNLNLFHDPSLSLQGVTIFESFVSDKDRGIKPMKGFEDLPDGTWFISAKVENPEVWAKIKSGEVKGFSVEGIFSYVKNLSATKQKDNHLSEIELMTSIKEALQNLKKALFDIPIIGVPAPAPAPAPVPTPAPVNLNTGYQLKDGTEITIDALQVGGIVMIAGVIAPAGEYEITDGTKITVGEGGAITAVTPVAAPVPMTPEQQVAAMNAAIQKFAAGSPEERIQNLELIAKALMEYSFGWQMREAQERANRDLAIEVYKTGFDKQETVIAEQKVIIEKQGAQIAGLFGIVEQLAETPTADSPTGTQTSFSTTKQETKEARLKNFAISLKSLKSKTA